MSDGPDLTRNYLQHQPVEIKPGDRVFIKNSTHAITRGSPVHELFVVVKISKTRWADVRRLDEIKATTSRRLIPGGRWWLDPHGHPEVSLLIRETADNISLFDTSARETPECSEIDFNDHEIEPEPGGAASIVSLSHDTTAAVLPRERTRDGEYDWQLPTLQRPIGSPIASDHPGEDDGQGISLDNNHSLEHNYLTLPFCADPSLVDIRHHLLQLFKLNELPILDKCVLGLMQTCINLDEKLEQLDNLEQTPVLEIKQWFSENVDAIFIRLKSFQEWLEYQYRGGTDEQLSALCMLDDKIPLMQQIVQGELTRAISCYLTSSPKGAQPLPQHYEALSSIPRRLRVITPEPLGQMMNPDQDGSYVPLMRRSPSPDFTPTAETPSLNVPPLPARVRQSTPPIQPTKVMSVISEMRREHQLFRTKLQEQEVQASARTAGDKTALEAIIQELRISQRTLMDKVEALEASKATMSNIQSQLHNSNNNLQADIVDLRHQNSNLQTRLEQASTTQQQQPAAHPHRDLSHELAQMLAFQREELQNKTQVKIEEKRLKLVEFDKFKRLLSSHINKTTQRFFRDHDQMLAMTDDDVKSHLQLVESELDGYVQDATNQREELRALALANGNEGDIQLSLVFNQVTRLEAEATSTLNTMRTLLGHRGLRRNPVDVGANKSALPLFSSDGTHGNVYTFEGKLKVVLEAKGIPTSERASWILSALSGQAQMLVQEVYKKQPDASWAQVFEVLRREFGHGEKLQAQLKYQHQKGGLIPEVSACGHNWEQLFNPIARHLSLIEEAIELEELYRDGVLKQSIITPGYMNVVESCVPATVITAIKLEESKKGEHFADKRPVEQLRLIKERLMFLSAVSNEGKYKRNYGMEERKKKKEVAFDKVALAAPSLPPPPIFRGAPPPPPLTAVATVSNQSASKYPFSQNLTCYNCQRIGHISTDCPNPRSPRTYYCDFCRIVGTHSSQYCFKNVNRSTFLTETTQSNPANTFPSAPPAGPTITMPGFSQVPGSSMLQGVSTCLICEKVALFTKSPLKERNHYYTRKGRLERHLCPTLTDLNTLEDRRKLIDDTSLCAACLSQPLSSPSHGGQACTALMDTKLRFLKCTENSCKLRSVLCVEHKEQNKTYLSGETQRLRQMSMNLCFVSCSQLVTKTKARYPASENWAKPHHFEQVASEIPHVLFPGSEDKKSHLYESVAELCGAVTKVRELPSGSPHFLLFMMKGLNNTRVSTIFDTAASYSLFKSSVLGSKIRATELPTTPGEALVGGLGGAQVARNFIALLPLYGTDDHQMIACQTVPSLVTINTADTHGLEAEIQRSHPEQVELNGHFSLPNFSVYGHSLEIEALIGIADLGLHPRLVLETRLGINIYWTPIQAAQSNSQFCFGGNLTSLTLGQHNILSDSSLCDTLTGTYLLSHHVYRDDLNRNFLNKMELTRQYLAIQANLQTPDFFGEDSNISVSENHSLYENKDNDSTVRSGSPALIKGQPHHHVTTPPCHHHPELSDARCHLTSCAESTHTAQGIVDKIFPPFHNTVSNSPAYVPIKLFCLAESKERRQTITCGCPVEKSNDWPLYFSPGVPSICLVATPSSKTQSFQSTLQTLLYENPTEDFRCPTCRFCAICKDPTKSFARSVQGDLQNSILRNCVTIDPVTDKMVARLPLPDNYQSQLRPNMGQCDKRLRSQLRKLSTRPREEKDQLLQSVDKLLKRSFIVDYIDLSPEEKLVVDKTDIGFFIPTSIVFKESLSTPCRLCLDASAKTPGGQSLNSILVKGEIELNMPRLIQNFRSDKIACTGDLSSFFNRVKMTPEHWSLQRFRWIPDLDPNGIIHTMVVKTVIYGVRPSPVLCHFALEKLKLLHPSLQEFLAYQYVDDLVKTYPDLETAKQKVKENLALLRKHELHFKADQLVFSGEKPADELLDGEKCVSIGPLKWNPVTDEYQPRVPKLYLGKPDRGSVAHLEICEALDKHQIEQFLPDKFCLSELLSKVASNYDGGSGLLSPLIAPLRQLTRDVLLQSQDEQGKTDWTFPLNKYQKETFSKLTSELNKMSLFWFPRYSLETKPMSKTGYLLVFSDSGDFETSIVYLSFLLENGTHSCQLMTAKSFLKKLGITVPKSELSAAAKAALMADVVKRNLAEFDLTLHLFCDSMTVIHWLANTTGVLATFQRNRVAQITAVFGSNVWHCRSEANPADDFSKGHISAEQVGPHSRFFNGPSWIKTGLAVAADSGIIKALANITTKPLLGKDHTDFEEGLLLRPHIDTNIPVPPPPIYSTLVEPDHIITIDDEPAQYPESSINTVLFCNPLLTSSDKDDLSEGPIFYSDDESSDEEECPEVHPETLLREIIPEVENRWSCIFDYFDSNNDDTPIMTPSKVCYIKKAIAQSQSGYNMTPRTDTSDEIQVSSSQNLILMNKTKQPVLSEDLRDQINQICRIHNAQLMPSVALAVVSFRPDHIICGTFSEGTLDQLSDMQEFLCNLVPTLTSMRVSKSKLHLTLLAFRDPRGTTLMEAAGEKLNGLKDNLEQMSMIGFDIFSNHLVVKLSSTSVREVKEYLMSTSKQLNIAFDPMQELHVTLFRNLAPEQILYIQNTFHDFKPCDYLGFLNHIQLFELKNKQVRAQIPFLQEDLQADSIVPKTSFVSIKEGCLPRTAKMEKEIQTLFSPLCYSLEKSVRIMSMVYRFLLKAMPNKASWTEKRSRISYIPEITCPLVTTLIGDPLSIGSGKQPPVLQQHWKWLSKTNSKKTAPENEMVAKSPTFNHPVNNVLSTSSPHLNFGLLRKEVVTEKWTCYPGVTKLLCHLRYLKDNLHEKATQDALLKCTIKLVQIKLYGDSLNQKMCRPEVIQFGQNILADWRGVWRFLQGKKIIMDQMTQASQDGWSTIMGEFELVPLHIVKKLMLPPQVPPFPPLWTRVPPLPRFISILDVFSNMQEFGQYTARGLFHFVIRTQDFMKSDWSKQSLRKETREHPSGILVSTHRWRRRIQSHVILEDPESYDLSGLGLTTDTPVVDKDSPIFISMSKFIHHTYQSQVFIDQGLYKHHRGASTDHLLSLSFLYAPGGLSTLKKIREKCMTCRSKMKRFINVREGSLHAGNLSILKAFHCVQLDLFGPYSVRMTEKGRTTRQNRPHTKVWGLIIVCRFSRAVWVELCEGVTVAALADAITRHQAIWGSISFAVTDQLRSQLKVLQESVFLEQVRLEVYRRQGFLFQEVPVSHHEWNGFVEVRVRGVRSMIGRDSSRINDLTILQFTTLLHLTCSLINNIPLGTTLRNGSSNPVLDVLTPNHFLVPRYRALRIQLSPMNIRGVHQSYFMRVEKIWEEMVGRYSDTVLPLILSSNKPYTETDNIQVGNLVLFKKQAQNSFTPGWTLGLVTKLIKGMDSEPRALILKYTNVLADTRAGPVKRPEETDEILDYERSGRRLKCGRKSFNYQVVHTHRQTNEVINLQPCSNEEDTICQIFKESPISDQN